MKSDNSEDNHWSTQSSRHVLKDRWISVRADTCRIPSGVVVDPYYVLEYPDWVHVVALDQKDRLLVTRQYRHGLKRAFLELPCGALNPGETPEFAARRELLEETGISYLSVKPVGSFSPNPATHSNLVHTFLCRGEYSIQGPNQDETEDIAFEYSPIDTILSRIRSGEFGQGLHIASLYLALADSGMEIKR